MSGLHHENSLGWMDDPMMPGADGLPSHTLLPVYVPDPREAPRPDGADGEDWVAEDRVVFGGAVGGELCFPFDEHIKHRVEKC